MKWAVTFGQRFNHEEHPVDNRIHGSSFVVFEGTETQAREQAHTRLQHWAFIYPYADDEGNLDLDFQRQITEYGLERTELDDGEQ